MIVPYTLKIRSGCEGGGKGALVQEDKSATLATNNDRYLFQPVIAIDKESYSCGSGFDRAPGIAVGGPCATLQTSGAPHAVCYAVENHPADSRVNIDESGKVQTLTSRMGTGGGNVPMVMEPAPIPIHDMATRFTGKRGDKSDGKGNGLGVGNPGDPMNTLTNGDRHAVVYAVDQGGGKSSANVTENKSPTLCTTHGGEPVIALDRASFNQGQNARYDFEISDEGVNSTIVARGPSAVAVPILHASKASFFTKASEGAADCLVATDYKDPQLVAYPSTGHYIVRRLTPTECARLQGFADRWGHIEKKDSLTDEELRFWQEVRNTHATINGKKVMEYTEKQMLTWYNKLWTDSAEYKMWGNGIALPPALYCLQGIVDALNTEEEDEDDDWLL